MKYLIENTSDGFLIKLSGSVSIQCIADLKKIIFEHCQKGSEIIIDNEKVSEVDLTYYQLLVSLYNFANDRNFKIRLINEPAFFQKMYTEIGIRDNIKLENIFKG